MFKKYFLLFASAALVAMLAAGCDKKDNPAADDTDDSLPTDNESGQPIPTFTNVGGVIGGTMATISFDFATIPGIPSVSYSMGFASFGDGLDAGVVSVNSNTLSKTTSGTQTFYNSFSSLNPQPLSGVNFNGSAHSWTVAGAGTVPALTHSVTSPASFTVSSPVSGGSVTKSSGMTITWTGSTSGDSVMIVLAGNGGYVLKQGVTGTTTTISSTELGAMSGAAVLQIVKYRYAVKTVSSKVYVAVAEIVKTLNVTIN